MQIDRTLGNVGVLYVGVYNPSTQYEYLNCVTYDGSSYVCVNQNGVTGVEPGTTDDWQLSAKQGDVGPVGPKPVSGVDYNTPEEKEEFKNDVVNKATEEVEKNIADIETEAIENYNENATQKTNEYDTNANRKLTAYNDNATQKTEEYNSNATSKVSEYNMNASTQIETFNNNATIKTNAFNDNYDEKMQAINEASTSIEAERKISDSKYARALKTPVTDVSSTQIYAENDIVDDLVINGVELTQVVTENSPSLDNPSEVKVASEQNITINETNITIPLTNSSIGQYADTIDRENKVQDKVIQELILTGNENYNFDNVEKGIYQYRITPAKKPLYINDSIIRAMSNYFKGVGRYNSWNIDNSITTNMSDIRFMTSQYTTVEDFKVKIKELYNAGTPVKVYYVAETPTKNSLQEEIQTALSNFKLYQDLNNVAIDGGSMSFIYNKSLSKTIEEMQDEIKSKDNLIQNLTTRVEALEKAQVDNVGGN